MADVTRRMLALLSTLQTGKSFSGTELAARLEVSPRTVRRDVERLRGYGYPVDTRPGPGGYYLLAAGRTMPPLVLDDDEAIATLLGLAALAATSSAEDGALDEAATRAYGKLDQFLPARLRSRITSLRASLETGDQRAPGVDAGVLGSLAEAIAAREVVAFDYHGGTRAKSRRRVEPHRQVLLHLRWYLLAWDVAKEDWRVFRVDRMADVVRTGSHHSPRSLPAATAVDYLRQGLNAERQRVEIVANIGATQVADAVKYQDAEITPLADGRTRITIWLDSWEWLLQALAFLDADFTIVEPAEFRTAYAAFARRLLVAAGGPELTNVL